LNAGDNHVDADFGYESFLPSGNSSIGDFVWEDTNGDGVQDAGEPGIAGVTLNLTEAGADNAFGTADDQTYPAQVTDGNGNYSFDNLPPGRYQVDVDDATLPIGATLTTANDPLIINLASNTAYVDADFGYTVGPIGLAKELIGSNLPNTQNTEAAIGEIFTYRLTIAFDPGTHPTTTITDILEQGLAFMDFDQDGDGLCDATAITVDAGLSTTLLGGFTSICDPASPNYVGISAEPVGDLTDVNQGRRLEFDLDTVINSTANRLNLVIEYRVVVLDNAGNLDGITLTNSAFYDPAVTVSAQDVTIVEPDLNLIKTVDVNVAGVGDVVTYTIEVFHTNSSHADAFDVVLADVIPAELTYVNGSLVHVAGQAPSQFITTSLPEFRVEWDTFLNNGTSSTIEFQAIVNVINPGTSVTNVAYVQWSSLPNDVSVPQSPYNVLSTERYYDPGDPVDIYGNVSSSAVFRTGQSSNNGRGENGDGVSLPDVGFAPDKVTVLPEQPQNYRYTAYESTWLEIPSLNVKVSITGVPITKNGWDITWLWNEAGYLEGTAFPTTAGNTAITGHVYLSNGLPGPFVNLKDLDWGDTILIHAWGQTYTYQVQHVKKVAPTDLSVLDHKDLDWITLLTCTGYDEESDNYQWRTAVQAVLVSVK
jgi:LPXTG-site transpeptidase (sortase) family protein